MVPGDGGMPIIRLDDFSDERVTYHVFGSQVCEGDTVDAMQNVFDCCEAGTRHGQIDLRNIACDDHLGVEPQTGQEHLHLLFGRVLCLVEDDESVVQRTAAHICKRGHLDRAVIHKPVQLFCAEHIGERIIQRPQVWIDLLAQRAGQEAEILPRLDRRTREDDSTDFTVLEGPDGLRHGEIGLSSAGRADGEGDRIGFNRIDIGDLPRGFGTDRNTGGESDDTRHMGTAAVLVDSATRLDHGIPRHRGSGSEFTDIIHTLRSCSIA